MTNEQKAALERLRAHEAIVGDDFRASPYYVEGRGVVSDKWWNDVFAAKNLALSEHPADDDEPATPEWGLSVGGEPSRIHEDVAVFSLKIDGCYRCAVLLRDRLGLFGATAILNPTRGNVRRLCRELGVPLKE